MPDNTQLKWHIQFEFSMEAQLDAKKINTIAQLVTDLMVIYSLYGLWHAWDTHEKFVVSMDVLLHVKINTITQLFLEISYLQESCDLIGPEHFGNNTRTRI